MSRKKSRRRKPAGPPAQSTAPPGGRANAGAASVPRRGVRLGLALALALAVVVAAGLWWWHSMSSRPAPLAGGPPAAPVVAAYVGRQICGQCHAQIEQRWRGSHHDLAMQPPTEATVAGDFNGTRFTYAGITSTFSRRDGKFVVRTDGPDGALADYEVKYTFGVSPLQQYLVELPGGRLQALGIAWDTRPRAQGGQRWFHLYPGQHVTHADELHWTRPSQNWNYMCAECHSTGVRKNYDPKTRSFATAYAEVNVSCEACHGPGSEHVAWARREDGARARDATKGLAVALADRRGVNWTISPETGTAQRTPPTSPAAHEVEVCGRCHARRGQFSEQETSRRALGDTHRVALLEDRLYFPDGQIRDEVYEYGSFRQSRMFHRGVTCSDCHDPHSGQLRAPGHQVCLGCHSADKYTAATHHFHPAGSRGADCLGCHMPTTTYMVVDPRRDHSLRVPRPDLSVALGVPNACTRCHADRPAAWAAKQVETWYGHTPRGYQRYAEALAAGTAGAPGATSLLETVARDGEQPAIARASAIARLAPASPGAAQVIGAALRDADPLVRRAAAAALEGVEPGRRIEPLAPLLDDPVRVVRMEAARLLAGAPRDRLPEPARAAFERAYGEYVAAERFNADRPESHLNLALLYGAQGRSAEAEGELLAALTLDPRFVPAAVNLADLYRATGRDPEGERVLRDALATSPRSAPAHHALGLLLVRQRRQVDALRELEAAARLAPESARYAYVHAVGLDGAGRRAQAIQVLEDNLGRHPYDRDTLAALVAFTRERGEPRRALDYARRLAALDPGSPETAQLVKRLEAEAAR
jgi:predicted CXXCH cytochrome family protein